MIYPFGIEKCPMCLSQTYGLRHPNFCQPPSFLRCWYKWWWKCPRYAHFHRSCRDCSVDLITYTYQTDPDIAIKETFKETHDPKEDPQV